jgi:hypothetical protein
MFNWKHQSYESFLNNALSNPDLANKPIFFLFEENPFWFATAHEVLKEKSKSESFILFIFGNSMPRTMDGTRNFIKKNQGGFFRNSNWIKYLLRTVIPIILPTRKASYVLTESLKGEDVVVLNLSKCKSKSRVKNRNIRNDAKYNDLRRTKWEKITIMTLGEILSTEYVSYYYSKKFINGYVDSGLFMEASLSRIIKTLRPVSVHYLNGRTFYERITLEVCKELGIETKAYETNTTIDRYQSFDESVGNLEFLTKSMDELWIEYVKNIGYDSASARGAQFFLDRLQDPKYNQFLLQMDSESSFSKNADDVVFTFFTSSREEMYSLYSLYGTEPPDQEGLILDLIKLFNSDLNSKRKLIIRVHPNLRSKRSKDQQFYKSLVDSKNVKVFGYDSGINSYQLVSNSDFVLTTVSTIGLEAAYLRVPTFCFGLTFWSGLKLSTSLQSIDKLFDSVPVDIEEAFDKSIKAGLYFLEYGEKYRFTDMEQLTDRSGRYIFDPLRWFVKRLNLHNSKLVQTSGFKSRRKN